MVMIEKKSEENDGYSFIEKHVKNFLATFNMVMIGGFYRRNHRKMMGTVSFRNMFRMVMIGRFYK